MSRSFFSSSGQSLVEAIVALGVLITAFLGILVLLSVGLRTNRIASDNTTGTYLAAEGIEIVRNILDHETIVGDSWGSAFSNGDFEGDYASTVLTPYTGRTLFFDAASHFYNYLVGVPTNFTRKIRITFFGPDEMEVNSIVSWTSGASQSSVNLEDHFMNWR